MSAIRRLIAEGMRDADRRVAAGLSAGPLDPIDRYLNRSAIVRRIDAATTALASWWMSSTTAQAAKVVGDEIGAEPLLARYRALATVLLIAVAVHVTMTLAQGARPGWFWLVIPLMTAAFALLLIAGSRASAASR